MTADQLVTVLGALGLEKLRPGRANIMAICPIHGERTPSFGVSIPKQYHPWGCLSCGAHGTLLDLVMTLRSVKRDKAKAFLAVYGEYDIPPLGGGIPAYGVVPRERQNQRLPIGQWAYFREGRMRAALWLLRNRGIPLPVSVKSDVGYDAEHGRVMFPWYDLDRKVIEGTTGRKVFDGDESPKVMAYNHFEKHRSIFVPLASELESDAPCWVVEGEIDALSLLGFGVKKVAACGGNPSRWQISTLPRLADRIVLAFDNDAAGRRMRGEVAGALANVVRLYEFEYPGEAKDPGEISPDDWKRCEKSLRVVI